MRWFLPRVPVWRRVPALTSMVVALVLGRHEALLPFAIFVGGIAPLLLASRQPDGLPADADIREAGLYLDHESLRAWWPGETDLARLPERVAAVADIALLLPRHVGLDHRYDPDDGARAGEQQR